MPMPISVNLLAHTVPITREALALRGEYNHRSRVHQQNPESFEDYLALIEAQAQLIHFAATSILSVGLSLSTVVVVKNYITNCTGLPIAGDVAGTIAGLIVNRLVDPRLKRNSFIQNKIFDGLIYWRFGGRLQRRVVRVVVVRLPVALLNQPVLPNERPFHVNSRRKRVLHMPKITREV
jgi:hypothetical protein